MTLNIDQLEERCKAVVDATLFADTVPLAVIALADLHDALAAAGEADGHP